MNCLLKKRKEIVIFGAGYFFELAIDYLQRYSVIAIIDNDPEKIGKSINSISVYPVEYVTQLKYDCIILCSSECENMKAQLISLGISENKIYSLRDFAQNEGEVCDDGLLKSIKVVLDIDFIRENHLELKSFNDAEILNYWNVYGEKNGLIGAKMSIREGMMDMLAELTGNDYKILEIGPFDNPQCKGNNVKYFDIYSSDRLIQEAKERHRQFNNVPSVIDYVSPKGDLSIVDEKFDVVFSSHCIEHQPNFIKHLKDVENILVSNGLYFLIIPDMRYTFDYFSSASTVGDVIEAYENKKMYNSLSDVLYMAYFRTHNNAFKHWMNRHGKQYGIRNNRLESDAYACVNGKSFFDEGRFEEEKVTQLISAYQNACKEEIYIDAHCNRFTPESFEYIISCLNKLGYINMQIVSLHNTPFGRQEFCTVLQKK